MFFDQTFERLRIAASDKCHEPHILGIFVRSTVIVWILLRHRDLDGGALEFLLEKCD